MWFIGIDVSKVSFDVAALSDQGEVKRLSCGNSSQGYDELVSWLRTLPLPCIALEATATYHRALVGALNDTGLPVSVLNPAQVSYFVKSQHRRNKTDTTDAMWLAVYARERRPAPTPPQSFLQQSLARELHALEKDLTRLKNRLGAALRRPGVPTQASLPL